MHITPETVDCEVIEAGQCAELRWERVDGLLAGEFTGLQVAPSDPNVIYATIDTNDMETWKSEDAGASWKRVMQWGGHPNGIAVHPTNPDIAVYICCRALRQTANRGSSWALWIIDSDVGGLEAVTFSPDEPDVAYAASSPAQRWTPGERYTGADRGEALPGDASILRSTDGGATWSEVFRGNLGSVAGLAVMPGNPDTVFAAASTGVHRSDDGGATWDIVLTHGSATDILWVAIAPDLPELMLATSGEQGVFRSTDGGRNWAAANAGLEDLQTHRVVFAPSDPNVAYLTTHNGVYRTDDGGQSWSRRSRGLTYPFVHAITVDPTDAYIAYVSTTYELNSYHKIHFNDGLHEGEGLYKTIDGGQTWFRSDAGLEEYGLAQMSTHPSQPFDVWVNGKSGRGLYFSPDGGETWLITPARRAAHYGMVLAFSRSFPTVMYLSSWVGPIELVRSADQGRSWSLLSEALLAGVSERSRALLDGGNSFHVHGLAVAPSDPNVIYVGSVHDTMWSFALTGAHIFRSLDGGQTWMEMDEGFPIETRTSINAIVVHPTDPNTVYAMTSRYESKTAIGIYKTTNGGATWSAANNDLGDLNTNDLQMDPIEPDTLYAATDTGVYKTTDGAQTWQPSSSGLPSGVVYDMALDVTNPLVLYAATSGGVYRTKDGGEHWHAVNLGLPLRSDGLPFGHDRVLEIDPTGHVVYTVILTDPHPGLKEPARALYRAVLKPLQPVTYEFGLDVDGTEETVTVESTSSVYDVLFNQNKNELRFTAAGPSGTKGETSLTVPSSLLAGPYKVIVDGQGLTSSTQGSTVTFEYAHVGRSEVVIRGSG